MAGIIGMTINKISAEKKKNPAGPVEIMTQPSITDVSEIKVSGIAREIRALDVTFTLNSAFKPDMGSIAIEGTILYKPDDSDAVIKEWKNAKVLPATDSRILLNHILSKVSIIGLYISDLLQLPPIVGLPRIGENKANERNEAGQAPQIKEKKEGKKQN